MDLFVLLVAALVAASAAWALCARGQRAPPPHAVLLVAVVGVASAWWLAALWGRDDTAREPLLQMVRSNFTRINPTYAFIPLRSGASAYTDDKTSITLCLTDPATGKAYDDNTIMYVALHELAHVVSTKIGHGDEFRTNFAHLLAEGGRLGFYDPDRPIPETYCGVNE